MKVRKAVFIDADYTVKGNTTYARLFVKGKRAAWLLFQYDPYFLVDAPLEKKDAIAKITARTRGGEIVFPKGVVDAEKSLSGKPHKFIKVICNKPADVPVLKAAMPYRCFEHGIMYSTRFMMDFGLVPFAVISYEREGRTIKAFRKVGKEIEKDAPEMTKMAFDIETYNPLGAPREKKDPAIMISSSMDGTTGIVHTYKDPKEDFAKVYKTEKEMIAGFMEDVSKSDPDIIYGYNSSNFDLPYLQARSDVLGLQFNIGRWGRGFRPVRKGMVNGADIYGRMHIDLYPAARFFGFIGLIKAQEFTLERIYAEVTGKKKKMVQRLAIWQSWDSDDIHELAVYSLGDSLATYELGGHLLPLLIELGILTRMPLFDTSLSTSGQLVECLLMHDSAVRGEIIPPKPNDAEVVERQKHPIEGAFVKLPEPGLYENIAVFDFRGLYPSIIISYNIDPNMLLEKDGGEDVHVSPSGARFLKEPKGLVPSTLDRLVDLRAGIKKLVKTLPKDTDEYRRAYARSHALKILSNSFYGYLGYARSRWYNRKCAESVTAWGRKHIMDAQKMAEDAGFRVLYADTDSLFLLLAEKKKEDALAFLDHINSTLPGKMELELENFYTRAVFVSKKQGDTGAKKKYAMIAEDGSIKVRGFELVRRDWSSIAKKTQYRVLEAILKEGDKEKAVAIVKETIEILKSGKASIEDLTIYTQLTKHPSEYDLLSPEVGAARKAIKKGIPLEKGSMVGFVIGKRGASISDKAEYAEHATDYDADYYINNQVLPAVMKILKELGYNEDELKGLGKQQSISDFF
jgi:DNA polymerase, archaea type